MAGVCKAKITVKLTGLGESITYGEDVGEVTLTVPVEHSGSPMYIIHSTAGTTAIPLSTLFPQYDVGAIYGVYIKCEVGETYIMMDSSSLTSFDDTTAHIKLLVGENVWIPLNPDVSASNGIAIDADDTASAFSIAVVVKSEA